MDDIPLKHRLQGRQSMLEGDIAVLEVRNSGPGLSREILNRIFEPFFTTKSSGMGMGLTISRSIMEARGGELVGLPKKNRK